MAKTAESQLALCLRPEDLLWPIYDRIIGLPTLNDEEKDALSRFFHGKIKIPKETHGPTSVSVQGVWYHEYKRVLGVRPAAFTMKERQTLKNIKGRCTTVKEACEMVVWFWEWRRKELFSNPLRRIEPSPFELQANLDSVREFWSLHRPVGPPAEFRAMTATLAEKKERK